MIKTIIFDWKRTLYDPNTKHLIDEAIDLLEYLKVKQIKLVLIGKGADEMHNEVGKLGVGKYFTKVIFQEGEKNIEQFRQFVSVENPQQTVFIGDRIKSELKIGRQLGAITIWVKHGKFADEEPANEEEEPTITVHSLKDCLRVLRYILR